MRVDSAASTVRNWSSSAADSTRASRGASAARRALPRTASCSASAAGSVSRMIACWLPTTRWKLTQPTTATSTVASAPKISASSRRSRRPKRRRGAGFT